jgi:hypothetical protein
VRDAGTCFGWRVESDLDLQLTRTGDGRSGDTLVVDSASTGVGPRDRQVIAWERSAGAPVDAAVFRGADGGSYRVVVDGSCFEVHPGAPRIVVPAVAEPVRREERLWGLPALLAFVARGDLPVHAAAVQVGAGVVLVAGPTRAGKTTLAAAAVGRGWPVLAEDLCCVRLDDAPVLLPGPASLRLRRDVEHRFAGTDHEVRDIEDERLHVALHPDVRGSGAPVPVLAIALLRTGDAVSHASVDQTDALRDLWALSHRLPESADRTRCFSQLADLVARVPVHDLCRPLTHDALDPTLDALGELAHA